MAYKQYTKCVSRSNYIGAWAAQAIVGAAVGALPLIFGASLVPGVLMIALTAIIAYCRWWLYDRLVCLGSGQDQCAIGFLLSVEPPENKSGLDKFDTDYSINIVLPPFGIGAAYQEVVDKGKQGFLLKNPDFGLDFKSYESQPGECKKPGASMFDCVNTTVLHCEFEGAGVYDLLIACLAALVVSYAAAVACTIPFFGWLACLILSIIAAAIALVGVVIALNDTANPYDVVNTGALHPYKSGKADILVVKGSWVYDSAHEGWNEIHPIKHCSKIGEWAGSWNNALGMDGQITEQFNDSNIEKTIREWCEAIGKASLPEIEDNLKIPENRWELHPLVDGCRPQPPEPLPN